MPKEYNEVMEILNHIPKEDFNKIPQGMVNMFKASMEPDYVFKYDATKKLQQQNVSKEARIIIAILFRDYWTTQEQREKIKLKENNDRIKLEAEKRERFNPDNLFKKKQ